MVLNSNISMAAGSPQEQWLRAELAANTSSCTLAYWHQPRFSSSGTKVTAAVKPLWGDLYAVRADVVVNAHYRVYERFAPQTPDQVADPTGIRQFTVGTGGQGADNFGKPTANSEVRSSGTYGVLKFTLSAGSYTWQFVPVPGGKFTDSGSGVCHTKLVAVAAVTVTPSAASLELGQTVHLTATPRDGSGNPLTGRALTWSTGAPAVATVDGTGLVTAVAAGSATITATSEGKSGTSAITVTTMPVAMVVVTPASATLQVGATVQLTATPEDATGTPLTGRLVTWSTGASSVATVDAAGLVTGVAAGSATITATSEGKSGTSAITVTASPGTAVVLVGAGDIADCSSSGDEATAALLDAVPGTVFTAGDNAYPDGAATGYTTCYAPGWGRHELRTRPSPGNHDYTTSGAPGYYGYFGANAGPSGQGYYSYDVGDWHVISLNSNISMSVGSAQETWLRADLAATAKQCTIAYWHHPRFSSGTTHGSTLAAQPLWQALYDYGAEIVVSAHEHNYERFAPQTPDGTADPVRGIRGFVVGTGGKTHYNDQGTPLANSEVFDGTTFGVLKLTLSAGAYAWQFIPVAGASFTDSGSGSCH